MRARAEGRKPFMLLPGAAHPVGVLGNALGFLELAAQLEARGEPLPSAVIVTAATRTTLAGSLSPRRCCARAVASRCA